MLFPLQHYSSIMCCYWRWLLLSQFYYYCVELSWFCSYFPLRFDLIEMIWRRDVGALVFATLLKLNVFYWLNFSVLFLLYVGSMVLNTLSLALFEWSVVLFKLLIIISVLWLLFCRVMTSHALPRQRSAQMGQTHLKLTHHEHPSRSPTDGV